MKDETKVFRHLCFAALHEQKYRNLRIAGKVKVCEVYYPPDKRHRDLGNLHKEVWDALEHEGVIINDEQIKCHCETLAPPDKANSRVEIDLYVNSWRDDDVIRDEVREAWRKEIR